MKIKTALLALVIGCSIIACPIMYNLVGPALNEVQLATLKILLIIAGCSAAYCFIAGEITRNNSQMDKLWSILPEVYLWVIAVRGNMNPRLVIMAVLGTIWGIRLTSNFAKKGAYSWKFWAGEEDYRWILLRQKKEFQPRWKWVLFDFFFISIYQNSLILLTVFPALVSMTSENPLTWIDIVGAVVMGGAVLYETIADQQQWNFQSKKWAMIKAGQKLEELPYPYNKGFNTTGLWKVSRHPNYLGEQLTWWGLYIFSISAGIGIFNWSLIGALLLVILFQGSSFMAEDISRSKYPEYENYCKTVNRFFPGKKYKDSE